MVLDVGTWDIPAATNVPTQHRSTTAPQPERWLRHEARQHTPRLLPLRTARPPPGRHAARCNRRVVRSSLPASDGTAAAAALSSSTILSAAPFPSAPHPDRLRAVGYERVDDVLARAVV